MILEDFKNFVLDHSLLDNNDKVLLSVSGGRDSVTLCELFFLNNIPFSMAHCNYHLRGEESNRDELFVKNLSKKYNTQLHIAQFNTVEFAKKNKISVEMAARQLRYDWYVTLCKQYLYNKIATAHHLNDQTETFFINLMRSTGINGIKGIPVKRIIQHAVVNDKNCYIIRPLLFASRKDIDNFVTINKLDYVDDRTNFTDNIFRNYIRLHILPVIEQISPDFPKTLQKSIMQFDYTAKLLTKLINMNYPKIFKDNQTIVTVPNNFTNEELRGYLYFALYNYGFNFAQINDISKSILSTGKIFYSREYKLLVNRQSLIVMKNSLTKSIYTSIPSVNTNNLQKQHTTSFFIEKNIKEIFEPIHLSFSIFDKSKLSYFKIDNNTALLDFDKLVFPLEISPKKDGEFFYPLGMNKRKKLSDFYIDEKFDLFTKNTTFAIRSNSNIIWVIGHRIDNRFKITYNTKTVFQIKII